MLSPQLSEPCPTLPFINTPPCQSNSRCCLRNFRNHVLLCPLSTPPLVRATVGVVSVTFWDFSVAHARGGGGGGVVSPSNSATCPRNAPSMAQNGPEMLHLGQKQHSSPKPRFGDISGHVARNPISRAPSPPATPHFLWFTPHKMAEMNPHTCVPVHAWPRQASAWSPPAAVTQATKGMCRISSTLHHLSPLPPCRVACQSEFKGPQTGERKEGLGLGPEA